MAVERERAASESVLSKGRAQLCHRNEYSCLWRLECSKPYFAEPRIKRPDYSGRQLAGLPHFSRTLFTYLDCRLADVFALFQHDACGVASREMVAISQAEFVLAVCLFAAAIFVYAHAQKLVSPLLIILVILVGFAISRELWFPDSFALRVVLEVSYRIIAITAAIQLMRFRRARWEIGPWLLCLSLLLVHLDWYPVNGYFPAGSGRVIELLLGFSILLVVFEDSQRRTRRLGVLNAVTTSITREQQDGPMLHTALDRLKGLLSAKAAWFRVLEGEKLVLVQQIGLSEEFVKDRNGVAIDEVLKRILAAPAPTVVETAAAPENIRPYFKKERFHHVLVMPVVGKKSMIGILAMGSRHRVAYAPEDMDS